MRIQFRLTCLAGLLICATTAIPAQQQTLQLWPDGNPEPSKVTGPEFDPSKETEKIVSGKTMIRVTNVSKPTLSVYSPDAAHNTGAAAPVFPGGS